MSNRTIEITPEAEGVLVVELNIRLRERHLAYFMAEALNSVFKQLTGFDHESMEFRSPPTPKVPT
jgi:hypothetical protein